MNAHSKKSEELMIGFEQRHLEGLDADRQHKSYRYIKWIRYGLSDCERFIAVT